METRHEPVLTRVPVAGHSLHRWLVGVPIILYAGTVAFFALYAYDHSLMWLRDAMITNLVAVVAAAIVAIPGMLDLAAIPDRSPARPIGLAHASLMVVVLALFVANLALHGAVLSAALKGAIVLHRGFDGTAALGLTGTALAFAVIGGAFGLVLAHRHHVGEAPASTTRPPQALTH